MGRLKHFYIITMKPSAPFLYLTSAIVFLFFSGLDRVIFHWMWPLAATNEWAEQAYRVLAMCLLAGPSIQLHAVTLFLVVINLVILPFNQLSPFINRSNVGFWAGHLSHSPMSRLIQSTASVAGVVGALSVLGDLVYISHTAARVVPVGFFTNPSFAIPLALSLFFINSERPRPELSGVVLAASLATSSRAVWILALCVVILLFKRSSLRPIVVATVIFGCGLLYPGSYQITVLNKIVAMGADVMNLLQLVFGSSGASDATQVQPGSASERLAGLKALYNNGVRSFWPLSPIHPNAVGHIGAVLYLSVYGLLLGVAYVILAALVASRLVLLLVAFLLLFYADPILYFGIGLLALRGVDR